MNIYIQPCATAHKCISIKTFMSGKMDEWMNKWKLHTLCTEDEVGRGTGGKAGCEGSGITWMLAYAL